MTNNKYDILINKTKELGLCRPLTQEKINTVEKNLNIVMPNDFKKLCLNCSYEVINNFELYNFDNVGKYSVVSETLDYRKIYNLSPEFLILSVGDTSAVIMKIVSKDESQVIWCDMPDFMNLLEGKPMEYNPTIFNSFAEFYEFLLDREKEGKNTEEI